MHEPTLIKSFLLREDVEANRMVSFDGDTLVRANGSIPLLGVVELASEAWKPADVILSGIAEVQAGADIPAGFYVTCDGEGRAIPAFDNGVPVLGIALDNAAEAEVIPVLLRQGVYTASGSNEPGQEEPPAPNNDENPDNPQG